jgi:chorismate mutase
VERERKCERLVREIAELKAERELQQLREERDEALESIAQSKSTHARSASLEQLGNPPVPKRAVIENMLMLLRSTIFSDPYHGTDMAKHTNYICTCKKIFRCDSGRHPSDLDKVNFAALYLRGNIDTAWE